MKAKSKKTKFSREALIALLGALLGPKAATVLTALIASLDQI
jgi:hypothetical protein